MDYGPSFVSSVRLATSQILNKDPSLPRSQSFYDGLSDFEIQVQDLQGDFGNLMLAGNSSEKVTSLEGLDVTLLLSLTLSPRWFSK